MLLCRDLAFRAKACNTFMQFTRLCIDSLPLPGYLTQFAERAQDKSDPLQRRRVSFASACTTQRNGTDLYKIYSRIDDLKSAAPQTSTSPNRAQTFSKATRGSYRSYASLAATSFFLARLRSASATFRKRWRSARRVSSTKRPMKSLSMAFAMAGGTSNSIASVILLFTAESSAGSNKTLPRFGSPLKLFHAMISPRRTSVFPVIHSGGRRLERSHAWIEYGLDWVRKHCYKVCTRTCFPGYCNAPRGERPL